MLINTKCLTP